MKIKIKTVSSLNLAMNNNPEPSLKLGLNVLM